MTLLATRLTGTTREGGDQVAAAEEVMMDAEAVQDLAVEVAALMNERMQ